MIVADKDVTLILTGNGDVLEPEAGIAAIGSGGNYALAAARALVDYEARRRDDRPQGDGDRRRGLRLHQRPADGRDAGQRRPDPSRLRERLGRALPHRSATRRSSPDLSRSGRRRIEHERHLTPKAIVAALDAHIIGQADAKRAVAVALRNRWRRQQLARRSARRGDAQEHPDDRADRLRQDRDQPPPGEARRRAVREGRGDQVHRGRLCRPRRRADRPRPGRGSDPAGEGAPPRRGARQGRGGGDGRACSTR